jgi:hypothetical protein
MTIDRRALAARHRIELTAASPEHVLTVGNGDFGVTVDASGMQTFTEFHSQAAEAARAAAAAPGEPMAVLASRPVVDTATLSTWGWHEMPNPEGYVLDDAMTEYVTPRGPVSYPDKHDAMAGLTGADPDPELRAGAWLHVNPQRLDLGRIGLELRATPEAAPEQDPAALVDLHQRQDLWDGVVTTRYSYAGHPVEVTTVADPVDSVVAYRIASPLLTDQRARVVLRFPYASTSFASAADWTAADAHRTELTRTSPRTATVDRTVDDTTYVAQIETSEEADVRLDVGPHRVVIEVREDTLELVVRFAPAPSTGPLPTFEETVARAQAAGDAFWLSGAALDLGAVDDPRAAELERRVVLSQHLTRIHCSGTIPPQETGLATNSWQGKFHLEMHYWHAAHFASWGRPELLSRSLNWYLDVLDEARATAARQHYPGARWPKQVGPAGRESPGDTAPLLAWQQPHPIHLLELVWQASDPDRRADLLDRFGELVDETATFMAAFPEDRDGARHLGPPIMPAQEFYDARTTTDPTFELAYWWFGLEVAQRWRERSGRARDDAWTAVQTSLARPTQRDGRYLAVDSDADLRRDDHPSFLAAFGVVPPTPLIDPDVMLPTLVDVLNDWVWPTAWGWDFPVMAMTATRLGQRELALDTLLRPEARNQITAVGHNPQLGALLPIYLPGNGALLSAVALMVAPGPDGRPAGFPAGWDITAEGFVAPL